MFQDELLSLETKGGTANPGYKNISNLYLPVDKQKRACGKQKEAE